MWETTSKVTVAEAGRLTEEPRTYNYIFNVKDQDGNSVWHTHPYLRVWNNDVISKDLYDNIGEGTLNGYGVEDEWEIDSGIDGVHSDWEPTDCFLFFQCGDTSNMDKHMATPYSPSHNSHSKNSPKWFGTVEPVTFTTVTPWENWKEGMASLRNCTNWRDGKTGNGQWTEFDEERCDAILKYMVEGPEGDQSGDNEEAAKEIEDTDWQTNKGICTDKMVEMEDESCANQIEGTFQPEAGCCLSQCDECVAPDCKCCTCNQYCNGVVQCDPLTTSCFEPDALASTNSCPCQCGYECPADYNPYCSTSANPGAECGTGTKWCPKSCRVRRTAQSRYEPDPAFDTSSGGTAPDISCPQYDGTYQTNSAGENCANCEPCCEKGYCEGQLNSDNTPKTCDYTVCDFDFGSGNKGTCLEN